MKFSFEGKCREFCSNFYVHKYACLLISLKSSYFHSSFLSAVKISPMKILAHYKIELE